MANDPLPIVRESRKRRRLVKVLAGPRLPRIRCAMCKGVGRIALSATRLARVCPTCRGSGLGVQDERFKDGFDYRANELGLAPRMALSASAARPARAQTGNLRSKNPFTKDGQEL